MRINKAAALRILKAEDKGGKCWNVKRTHYTGRCVDTYYCRGVPILALTLATGAMGYPDGSAPTTAVDLRTQQGANS